MAQVVNDSLKGIEFTMRPSIYHTKEDEKDEMLDIAQNGKFMMQAMAYAADELMELAKKNMVSFSEKTRIKQRKRESIHGTKL